MKKYPIILTALSLMVLLSPINAYAYLDPGFGSLLLQGVLGGIAAVSVVLRLYWHQLLKLLGLRKDKNNNIRAKQPTVPKGNKK